jgi:flagellar hook assembly protein FlgD
MPNPFFATTTLSLDLPAARHVSLALYGIDGRLVRRLVDQELDAGHHRAVWDGRDERGQRVASGVYFARIQAGEFTTTHRLVRLD